MESWLDREPVSGVRLDLCATDDVDCSHPFATNTTEANGEATVTVPLEATSFDGYVRWTKAGWTPGMGFLKNPPIAGTPAEVLVFPMEIPLISDSRWVFAGLGEGDPERGSAFVRLLDCAGNPAAGVLVTLDAADDGTGVYYSRGGPLSWPAEVPYSTDDGWAVFMNVPPGPVTATAVTVDTEEVVGTVDLLVRAGHQVHVTLVPSPPQ
jgi:hypothetical protein